MFILKKEDNFKVSYLNFQLKKLEKETIKCRVKWKKEIITGRLKINEIDNNSWENQRIQELVVHKINKINKPLANLIKKGRDDAKITKTRKKKGDIMTDLTDIQ